jgi:hypothetical protein
MVATDPDYSAIVARATVERLAQGTDEVATWAKEMLSQPDEEAVFLRGVRVYFERSARTKRRQALAFLAATFDAKREDLKRYLRFKGIVNLMD